MARRWTFAALLAGCFLVVTSTVQAQGNNANANGNTNANTNAGGIRIDASGVVSQAITQDRGGKLDKKRKAALLQKAFSGDVSRPSELRTVSLVRLEAACANCLETGKPFPPEIKCLAGLTQVEAVFVDLEDHDLLLCGPAEPFLQADSGRWLGAESGRPVLLLDDLLVALRAVQAHEIVGCSIDPVAERLAKLQVYLRENSSPATVDIVEARYHQMREILGLHTVTLMGVPEDSHFARGLVEADFRLKLLALGLEKPGIKGFRSHLGMIQRGNTMQRWWFVPLYDHISRTEDGLSFEFAGQRAQLLGEDELANAQGVRFKAGTQRISTEAFAQQFTEKFPQLAAQMPVFAELQNLIDWTLFAAIVKHERLLERIDWPASLFLDAEKLPHEVWPVPKQTECVLNMKRAKSGMILGQLSGGVTIDPGELLQQITRADADATTFSEQRKTALNRSSSREHPWWWDKK